MHKLLCSRCLQRVNVILPALPNRRQTCVHVRPYSRWFALYEDVNQVDIPISELPSSSSYTHTAPIGLNDFTPTRVRRSVSATRFPTEEDSSQLGGRDTVDEAVSSTLGVNTGSPSTSLYDLDSLLATVEESNLELPMIDVVPSRDLLPASSLRPLTIAKQTRTSQEKEKSSRSSSRGHGVRARFLGTAASAAVAAPASTVVAAAAAVPAATAAPIAVPAAQPTHVTAAPEQVQQVSTSVSPVVREGEMNVMELVETAKSGEMDDLRLMLAMSHWPKNRMNPMEVQTVFSFVVRQSKSCEECRDIMRDFACASTRHTLTDGVLLDLVTRSMREEGMVQAVETMRFHQKTFMMPPVRMRAYETRPEESEAVRVMWREAATRGGEGEARELCETAMEVGLVRGPRGFVKMMMKEKERSGASFNALLSLWRRLGARYNTLQYGMDILVERAMREEGEEERRNALGQIAAIVSSSAAINVESFVAHLVTSLLSRGEEAAARHVYSLIAIHGRHWKEIVGAVRMEQSAANLVLIERIANLMTYGVIGELKKTKRGGGGKKGEEAAAAVAEETVAVAEVDPLGAEMEKVVWRAAGGKKRGGGGGKKTKKRVVRVDEKEAYELGERIQRVWMGMEKTINGPSSPGLVRLIEWSMLHRLGIPDGISHMVPERSTVAKRESIDKKESTVGEKTVKRETSV